MAAVGPFEKHHRPRGSSAVTAEEGPADTGGHGALHWARASPPSRPTNQSGAGAVLRPGSSSDTADTPETREHSSGHSNSQGVPPTQFGDGKELGSRVQRILASPSNAHARTPAPGAHKAQEEHTHSSPATTRPASHSYGGGNAVPKAPLDTRAASPGAVWWCQLSLPA